MDSATRPRNQSPETPGKQRRITPPIAGDAGDVGDARETGDAREDAAETRAGPSEQATGGNRKQKATHRTQPTHPRRTTPGHTKHFKMKGNRMKTEPTQNLAPSKHETNNRNHTTGA